MVRRITALLGSIVALASSGGVFASPAPAPFRDCTECPQMIVVPPGAFEMGAADDAASDHEAKPRHRVTIARAFAVGIYEVTRAEFARFVAATGIDAEKECQVIEAQEWKSSKTRSWRDPGYAQGESEPVVCVSWNDAHRYVEWLSRTTGKPYRLLSESEWEYLARAGLSAGKALTHDIANYGGQECCVPMQSGRDRWDYTAPVGSFPANIFGVHDILGNVWEWLADCYHESYANAPLDGSPRIQDCSLADRRSVRGGGWGDGADKLDPAYRLRGPLDSRYFTLGFRVARTIP